MHGHPDTRHIRDGDDVLGRGDVRGLDDVRDRDDGDDALIIMPVHILQPVAFAALGTPEHPERGANNDHCGNQLEPRFC